MQSVSTVIPNEEWRKVFFDESPIPCATVSVDHSFVEVNDAYCAILGFARHELVGKTWQSITHPEDVKGDLRGAEDVISGKTDHYRADKRYIKKFGSVVLGTLDVRGVRENGKLQGFLVRFLPIIDSVTAVKYDADKGHAEFITGPALSPLAWAAANPWPSVSLILGLALLLGAGRVVELIKLFL